MTRRSLGQRRGWGRAGVCGGGILPPPAPSADPAAAEQLHHIGSQLEAWRDQLAQQLDSGEPPPQWAARLGPAPAGPSSRDAWARAVAQIALYRAVYRIEDDSLLGPDVPLGSPQSRARAAAARAARVAEQLANDTTPPARKSSALRPARPEDRPSLRPAQDIRPFRPRP
jgi:hypothetical protein